MADLTAGGVPVSRDSAGVLREQIVSAGDSATAMLSPTEFTPEQAAMARLPLPFRNLIRDPFVPGISAAGVTTAYPTDLLQWMADKGVSSFRIINPNACYIRFRGATGTGDVIKEGEGRLMAPLARWNAFPRRTRRS